MPEGARRQAKGEPRRPKGRAEACGGMQRQARAGISFWCENNQFYSRIFIACGRKVRPVRKVFIGIVLPLETFRVRQWISSSENGFWRLRRLAPEAKIFEFHLLFFMVWVLQKQEGRTTGLAACAGSVEVCHHMLNFCCYPGHATLLCKPRAADDGKRLARPSLFRAVGEDAECVLSG